MTFTIEAGWWLVPLFITIGSFVVAAIGSREDTYGLAWLFLGGMATIVSLIAWLVWALIT